MKLMQYTYNFEPEMYKYILSSNILNKKKEEDKIFKALVDGYNSKEISEKYHYCQSTIWNRRRDIYNKTKPFMKNYLSKEEKENILNGKRFKVYLLTFLNNKVYVGITSQEEKDRWKQGSGYVDNKEMFNDIIEYGWQNVKKDILYKDLTFEEAREKEKELIIHYKSHMKKYGYNKEF